MVVFDVRINGKRVVRAGRPGYAVLTAMLSWLKRRPARGLVPRGSDLGLYLSGSDSNGPVWEDGKNVEWTVPKVRVGDSIAIRILDSKSADPPSTWLPPFSWPEPHKQLARGRKKRKQLDQEIGRLERVRKRLRAKGPPTQRPTAAASALGRERLRSVDKSLAFYRKTRRQLDRGIRFLERERKRLRAKRKK
jgi:hypothetical protein